MSELENKIKQKIKDGEGRVSFAFGIKPILDEAKAEFPDINTWSKGDSYEDAEQKYLDAVEAWFKKWLGDAEKGATS